MEESCKVASNTGEAKGGCVQPNRQRSLEGSVGSGARQTKWCLNPPSNKLEEIRDSCLSLRLKARMKLERA